MRIYALVIYTLVCISICISLYQKGKIIDTLGEYLEKARSVQEIRNLKQLRFKIKDKIEKLQKYYKTNLTKKEKKLTNTDIVKF